MSCAEPRVLTSAVAFVHAHHVWAYPALFVGACLETLVPLCLVVPGELIFLCGATLAGMGMLDLRGVLVALYGGGVLGDNCSYWIGRRYGPGLWQLLERCPLIGRLVRPASYQRGVAFFRQRGAWAVFAARLSGPLSWIVPALAGTLRLDYRPSCASTPRRSSWESANSCWPATILARTSAHRVSACPAAQRPPPHWALSSPSCCWRVAAPDSRAARWRTPQWCPRRRRTAG